MARAVRDRFRRSSVISGSGVRDVRLGGVNEMNWDVEVEDGKI